MKIRIPVVQHFLGHVLGADQPGEILAGKGVITAIDFAQQILARDRHIFGISSAEVVVTLVSTGAALHARIEKDLESFVVSGDITELGDGLFFPVVDQPTGKANAFLMISFGNKRAAVRHHSRLDMRNDGVFC